MRLKKLISKISVFTLILPLLFLVSPTKTDAARATYEIVRENGSVTGGIITVYQQSGYNKLFHQPQNDLKPTLIDIARIKGSVQTDPPLKCNGYYSVLFYDDNDKLIKAMGWHVSTLSFCEYEPYKP